MILMGTWQYLNLNPTVGPIFVAIAYVDQAIDHRVSIVRHVRHISLSPYSVSKRLSIF